MVTVHQKFIHTGARKLRLLADAIRGKSLKQAKSILAVLPQRGAKTINEALSSAQASAKNAHLTDDLWVETIFVDEGPAMKRRVLAGRGRATRFEHRMSHVTLSLDTIKKPTSEKPSSKRGKS